MVNYPYQLVQPAMWLNAHICNSLQEFIITKHIVIPFKKHGIAVKQLCPHATEVVRRLQEEGYDAYIVGGSVRDLLLGKVPKDYDVATDAIPEEVKTVFPRARLIGRRFRLAHVRLGGTLIEVATFRGPQVNDDDDHKHDNGRILRDNVWGSLEEDAVRRDFTINALFMDPVSGDIQDFVGGYKDLSERKLRLIGDPVTRYREDPVRLLRAARFVAKLGVELGLPYDMVYRHPFPGPGLGVRILGEVKKEYADILRLADNIFIEELYKNELYHKVSQAFTVFLPVKSVGVTGDGRRYQYVVSLRAVETIDFMTARWAPLPHEFLEKVSLRIANEINGVSRVVYDISGKPPATIEWE